MGESTFPGREEHSSHIFHLISTFTHLYAPRTESRSFLKQNVFLFQFILDKGRFLQPYPPAISLRFHLVIWVATSAPANLRDRAQSSDSKTPRVSRTLPFLECFTRVNGEDTQAEDHGIEGGVSGNSAVRINGGFGPDLAAEEVRCAGRLYDVRPQSVRQSERVCCGRHEGSLRLLRRVRQGRVRAV